MRSAAEPPPSQLLAHQHGSELERKAAEERARRAREKAERDRFAAQQKPEAESFAFALERPCHEHDAAPGKPAWRLPVDEKHYRAGRSGPAGRVP